MSDWSAQHSGVGSVLAGLDMTMPGDTSFDSGRSFWGGNLTLAGKHLFFEHNLARSTREANGSIGTVAIRANFVAFVLS